MTPNTGNYDVEILGHALISVLADVKAMTGKKTVYLTHRAGESAGRQTRRTLRQSLRLSRDLRLKSEAINTKDLLRQKY